MTVSDWANLTSSLDLSLRPHFANRSLCQLGVHSCKDLQSLRYHISGEPIKTGTIPPRSHSRKRMRYDYSDDPDYNYGEDSFRDRREFDDDGCQHSHNLRSFDQNDGSHVSSCAQS